MSTLYELQGQFQEIYNHLIAGEIDEQTFNDTLESIDFKGAIETKAEGYAHIIANLENNANTVDDEIKRFKSEIERLTNHKNSFANKAARMKERLQAAMIATDNRKIKTALFSFNVQANPEKVVVEDLECLKNQDVWKKPKFTEAELDKTLIKKMMQEGKEIKGARLEKTESLRIK